MCTNRQLEEREVVVLQMASSLASQLPHGSVVYIKYVHDTKHCGSWLASDG
jgi:hypothetical protein